MKCSFDPVADAATRILILGSLPGDVSLIRGQYYGHPHNQFWALVAEATGLGLAAADYEARLALLRSAGIGLWDVIQSAERIGSLDARIREAKPNGLQTFIAGLPHLRLIAFNGAKASVLGRKLIAPAPGLALVTLPSSSPAHAIGRARKQAAWTAALTNALEG